MNRNDLQHIAQLRIKEANVLLANRCFEGAYYLSGYAIECALKACIAKQTQRYDFPELTLVKQSYTHDLEQLLRISGLKVLHQHQLVTDLLFALNWTIVKDWSEEKRYTLSISEIEAHDLYSAITNRKHGVLVWLKKLW